MSQPNEAAAASEIKISVVLADMPTVVVAAASFDDMVAITGYTIFINIAIQVQTPRRPLPSTADTSVLHCTSHSPACSTPVRGFM